jgi:glycosyltransferase involved in cell wall biosynthesis
MSKRLVVSIAPAFSLRPNSFARQFAHSIAENGIDVREFSWRLPSLWAPDVIIFHWPNLFFSPPGGLDGVATGMKLKALEAARRLRGARLVWVAHNLWPHDRPSGSSSITGSFLGLLDGVIYLSRASRTAVLTRHPALASVPALITAHGHYRSEAIEPPSPARRCHGTARLLFFGQVRRYKNIDRMLACVRSYPDQSVHLRVVGLCEDDEFAAQLQSLAGADGRIALDLKPQALSNAELERVVDEANGIVLPYRDVLNSGAAIYALSRNRPVLVPDMGSLPELQQEVGATWVHVYGGELTPGVLASFVQTLRAERPQPIADLSAFEWSGIGRQLAKFIVEISN